MEIGRSEYLVLLGLFTVAQEYAKKARQMEKEIAKRLPVGDGTGYAGCISDAIYTIEEEYPFDQALEYEGVTVKENNDE